MLAGSPEKDRSVGHGCPRRALRSPEERFEQGSERSHPASRLRALARVKPLLDTRNRRQSHAHPASRQAWATRLIAITWPASGIQGLRFLTIWLTAW